MDIANKIKKLEIVDKEFTPEGESRKVQYRRLQLTLTVSGVDYELELPGKVTDEFVALCGAADEV